jgi:hypothetical protein
LRAQRATQGLTRVIVATSVCHMLSFVHFTEQAGSRA